MARLTFRQGIVRHQTDAIGNPTFLQQIGQYVNLIVSPDTTIITLVDGTTDYMFTESVTVSSAWGPFVPGPDVWLYWDINRITGIRTFGSTLFEPIEAAVAPLAPAVGQMWFNTGTNIWSEWSGASWVHVIRVFSCKLAAGTAFVSMSINAPAFIGTQVGLTTASSVGSLMFDGTGNPIFNSDSQFFTTEDIFTTGVPTGASLKVNNVLFRAQAQLPIAAYNVVMFSDFNQIVNATPITALTRVYGFIEEDVSTNEIVNVVTEGIIFNEAWDWPAAGASVNSPVYSGLTGEITLIPTAGDDRPVGAVIGIQSILFDPTLYGLESSGAGDHGTLLGLGDDDHTQYHDDIRGDIRYYQQSIIDANFSLINHTHLKADILDFAHTHMKADITDFAHTHVKTDITDFAHTHVKADITDFAHTHLVADITDLPAYLELAGGTMTGILTLFADPVDPLDAATKAYVDNLVNGLLWRDPIDDPNFAGLDINDPSVIVVGGTADYRLFSVGSTPVGLWSAFPPGMYVRWNGTIWESWDGANGLVQVGDRLGIAMEPPAFPPTVIGALAPEVGKIITITGNTPGAITYGVSTPVEPEATFTNNENSDHFSHTYSFVGTYGVGTYGTEFKWIEVASIVSYVGGANIDIATGNIINVSPQGAASGLDADLWDGEQSNISSPANGELLTYSAGNWINAVPASPTGGTNITIGLGDTINVSPQGIASGLDADLWDGQQSNISGPVDTEVLTYSGGVWINSPAGGGGGSSNCMFDTDSDTFVTVGVNDLTGGTCDFLDDTFWSSVNAQWTGSVWESIIFGSSGAAGTYQLNSIGVWDVGFRPDTLEITVYFQNASPIGDLQIQVKNTAGFIGSIVNQAIVGQTELVYSIPLSFNDPGNVNDDITQIIISTVDEPIETRCINFPVAVPCVDTGSNDVYVRSGRTANVAGDITLKASYGTTPGNIILSPGKFAVVGFPMGINDGTIQIPSNSTPTHLEFYNNIWKTTLKASDNLNQDTLIEFPTNDGPANSVLVSDGAGITVWQANAYDVQFSRQGVIADADIITRFVSPRSVEFNPFNGQAFCEVAPLGAPAVFDISTTSSGSPATLVSRGTVTFAIGSRIGVISIGAAFSVNGADHVIVTCTTASSIEGVTITLNGSQQS